MGLLRSIDFSGPSRGPGVADDVRVLILCIKKVYGVITKKSFLILKH